MGQCIVESATNYWLIWLVYLGASTIFLTLFWRMTRFSQARWLSYSLRAVTVAIILTPWYANPRGDSFAPALVVILLDAITIGGSAAARAVVPLILAVILALLVAVIALFLNTKIKINIDKKQIDKDNT